MVLGFHKYIWQSSGFFSKVTPVPQYQAENLVRWHLSIGLNTMLQASAFQNILRQTFGMTYGWWLKSCTTWDVWNPINNGILYISTGAGFLPSTVCRTKHHPILQGLHTVIPLQYLGAPRCLSCHLNWPHIFSPKKKTENHKGLPEVSKWHQPTQCTHFREIPGNYHTFALSDPCLNG